MNDLQILKQLAKQINTKFTKVDISKILEYEFEKTAKYALDINNNIIGLKLEIFYLKKVPLLISLLNDLTHLNLYNNQISHISPLQKLKQIKVLHLSSNKINDISSLKELKQITTLNLSLNRIIDISPLKELKELTKLDLSNNNIRNISALQELKQIKVLHLSSIQISDISPLRELKQLTMLDLSNNKVRNISPLRELKQLTKLVLHKNQISDISPLKGLKQITEFYIWGNEISDISPLKELKQITQLVLSENQISDISPFKELKQITWLDLSNNQISDIFPLKELKQITRLDLRSNPIKELPEWITDYDIYIEWTDIWEENGITFYNNPFEIPPVEIVKQGKEAIRNYFKQLKEAKKKDEIDYLFEAKLLLVGEERAGKSTIVDAITDPNFKIDFHKSSTHGINISKWDIPKEKVNTLKDFRFNTWDFGGQEIYHATHQFFLTKRSLYLFVTEARKDLRYDDFYYWLNIINTLAGNSPVLLVQNKADHDHIRKSIDEYREMYPQITADLQTISCNTEHKDWNNIYKKRLDLLKEEIYKILKEKSLEGIGDKLPQAWMDIRKDINELQNKGRNCIELKEYYNICKKHGLNKKEALHLIEYFHDLGVLLYFRKDIQLKNIIFLNHEWVTKAIYNVFDSKKVKDAHGKFTDEDLMEIWDEPQFADKQAELLNLMKNPQFKICYEHKHKYYLAPQLFDDKQVDYKSKWRTKENNLRFCFQYEFMPKGILSQLIVMMHDKIYNDTFWRRGILFVYKDSRAIVIEDRMMRNNLIKIQVEGDYKKELLSIIAANIEEINSSYTNLNVTQKLGCNCSECKNSENPHYFKYDLVWRAIRKGKNDIECQLSFDSVNIGSLLDRYITRKAGSYKRIYHDGLFPLLYFKYNRKKKDYIKDIHANTEELIKGHKEIIKKLDEHYNYLMEQTKNKTDLKEIEQITKEIQRRDSEKIVKEIIGFMASTFLDFDQHLDKKLKVIYDEIKNTDIIENKIKLAVPLLNLIGINIETEFNLNRFIKRLFPEKDTSRSPAGALE